MRDRVTELVVRWWLAFILAVIVVLTAITVTGCSPTKYHTIQWINKSCGSSITGTANPLRTTTPTVNAGSIPK